MLTLRQMDNIVQNDLFVIQGCEFKRQEQGGSILYTVFINTDSGKLSLGKYRVWEWHNGSSRSGWIPFPGNTNQEIEKLRSFILQMIITDANRAENNSIRDIFEISQETIPLGLMLYKAAKDVIDMSPFGVIPELDSLSPSQKGSRIIMSYACNLALLKDASGKSNLEAFRLGFYDFILPKFAASFLQQFPTPFSAKKKFPRIIRFSDFLSEDTRSTVEQILNLTVEEANTLIKAKPLLENLRNDYLRSSVQPSTIYQPTLPPTTDDRPIPTNLSDELRVIADSEAGTILFKKDKQGGLIPQGGSINPGYDVVLVPKPFGFSGTAGAEEILGVKQTVVSTNTDQDATRAGSGKPEPSSEPVTVFSQRIEALNKLAVFWVRHNQNRLSKQEDMSWFLGEFAEKVGLQFVTTNEFKKHLPKACKAGIINKDINTGRYIPKLAT